MPRKDIAIKVNPYRQILGSNLWNDILLKFMASDISVSSTILSARKKFVQLPVYEVRFVNPSLLLMMNVLQKFHLGLTADCQNMKLQKIPYKFNLLLRDGFTREIFHKLCDNIPGTVAIIKVNGTNEILGGYNLLVWTSNKLLKWN
ncbi:hypothetical protein C2G38_2318526 [Gigaspora rosea]|uniref:TLDc domain-containing protein n=1 Tax=Gigaspora rosea TaxID=44941 RepID=A0A397V1K6_9GLOM|nr:hypothetical protein C2G38_2318526 [Gigaspora rosea]